MKKLFIIGSVCGFAAMISGQSAISKPEDSMSKNSSEIQSNRKNEQQCTPSIDGLIFCISSPSVSVKLGQSVPVVISVRNITDKNISLPKDYFDNSYDAKVVDSNGERILSLKEERQKKNQANTEITEEMIKNLPINPPYSSFTIPSGEEKETTFNLGYFYDFKTKGKYKVEIRRKTAGENAALDDKFFLGSIEIEIK